MAVAQPSVLIPVQKSVEMVVTKVSTPVMMVIC